MNKADCCLKIVNIIKSNAYACYLTDNEMIKNIFVDSENINYLNDLKLQDLLSCLIEDKNFIFNRKELSKFYTHKNDKLNSKKSIVVNNSFVNYFKLDKHQYIVFVKHNDVVALFENEYLEFDFPSYERITNELRKRSRVNYNTKYNKSIMSDSLIKKPLMFYTEYKLSDFEKENAFCIECGKLISHDEDTFKRLYYISNLKKKINSTVKNSYIPLLIYDKGGKINESF